MARTLRKVQKKADNGVIKEKEVMTSKEIEASIENCPLKETDVAERAPERSPKLSLLSPGNQTKQKIVMIKNRYKPVVVDTMNESVARKHRIWNRMFSQGSTSGCKKDGEMINVEGDAKVLDPDPGINE
ncbi:OLC1v1001696C1 [Oldenlandia corymbosa var. corymbosa]|uniref:OLC1v1001696C1 n=1 Tax=Oldenlandia corymbosa var. corymbosa TaxID=529605 RepID=A0AAV1D867_OLDCO|nr:OLC1v1001696C1 [Oldenlandia corymbosa var. corymbosa]